MAQLDQDWDELGRSIQDIIDRAVNSQDYQKLNQTIRQVVDKAVDAGSEAVRKAVDGLGRTYQEPKRQAVVQERKPLPVLYGTTGGMTAKGVLKIVGGGVLSCVTFAGSLTGAVMNLIVGSGSLFGVLGGAVLGLAAGLGLIYNGICNLSRVKRFKSYRTAMGHKTVCTLEKLSRAVGKSVKFVRRELLKMIDEGLFLEGHMDKEQTCLITSHETYRQFEQSRLQLEERQRQEALEKAKKPEPVPQGDTRVREVLDRGNAFIAEIRRCNDLIPGEEISGKIDRMEQIVRQIFRRAEAHPEIVPDLKKLMDYYLPMTVKLLNAYADMDAQPVQGENILNSKREIEQTLDTLNSAYEKLLDELYEDKALDISSDISVLNTLLAQEGLTQSELDVLKKENEYGKL